MAVTSCGSDGNEVYCTASQRCCLDTVGGGHCHSNVSVCPQYVANPIPVASAVLVTSDPTTLKPPPRTCDCQFGYDCPGAGEICNRILRCRTDGNKNGFCQVKKASVTPVDVLPQ